MTKILFLAANPVNTPFLKLDEEVRAIDQALIQSQFREHFTFEKHFAVRYGDLQQILLRHQPDIVHFSGHGGETGELLLQGNDGMAHPIREETLSRLFSLLKDKIRCVVLNACYSETQAAAIAEHVDVVIGMKNKVGDDAARHFAAAFYQGLGFGRTVQAAFELGCLQIDLANLDEADEPQLKVLQGSTSQFIFIHTQVGQVSPIEEDIAEQAKYNVSIETPYGTMLPNSKFYIEREADLECFAYIDQSHAFTLYVQAPRQMGKSSLLHRFIYLTNQIRDCAIAFIDFEKFTEDQFETFETFLQEFCFMVTSTLGIPDKIDQHWPRRGSNIIKCSNYFSNYIIPYLNQPLILVLDEVEKILYVPFRNDFFAMLRTWHNDRAYNDNFSQMSMLLSSSTQPQLFIDNINQSPFNVVQPILLNDFTLAEVQELNQLHPIQLSHSQILSLMELVSGHPFLTRLSLYLISTQRYNYDSLLKQSTLETSPFESHLNYYWRRITESPELKYSLYQICQHQTHPIDTIYYRLKGAGLIKRDGARVVMRNQLYERYFSELLNVK